jgi:hypothetical protein
MTVCRNCGDQLPAASGRRGPPKTYCSVACRRSAEFEIRRINDRLGNLEKRLSECRLPVVGMGIFTMDDPGALEKEIQLQRQRLLDLLCDETAPPSGPMRTERAERSK